MFARTLLTPFATAGVITRKRPICIHAESTGYGWIGLPQTRRISFEPRY